MPVTISRLFDDEAAAARAVAELEAVGLRRNQTVVASTADHWYAPAAEAPPTAPAGPDRDAAGTSGADIAAAIGGAAVIAGGLALLAVPGLGAVVAGGIVGALIHAGMSEDEAHVYAEGVRRGGTLVTAQVPEAERVRYEAILANSAVDLGSRTAAYRSAGWSRFEDGAPRYSADQIRAERERHRQSAA